MKHLEYKGASDAGYFTYWDKDLQKEVTYDLEVFNIREIKYTVRGFQIWSNDITNFSEEKFTVRNKEKVLAEGLYKEIKEKLPAIEAKLFIKIVSDNVTLYFKGQNYFNINELLKKKPKALKFTGFLDKGKGIKYREPTFEIADEVPVTRNTVSEEATIENLPF